MEKIKSLYNKIMNIGVYEDTVKEYKKIRLLNAFSLTWAGSILLFMMFDPFFSQNLFQSLKVHGFSFLCIIIVYTLQKFKKYTLARVVYISALISVTFIFSNFIEPLRLMENFYFVFPLIALVFIDTRWITITIMIVCWLLYYVPFKLETNKYPEGMMNPVLILTVFTGTYIILNYSKVLNKKSEQKLLKSNQKLELAYIELEERKKSEFAHLQLKSLRAQMNPHFMFNAMNSIQSLVLKGDKHEAYSYLTKFASLIRENLNMSEKSFIEFDEELSLLKKYLELEKLRFREDFEYKIINEHEINDIKIPSMIIQPFIENAIKHGLLHKIEGLKKIKIEFYLDTVLKCIITDNGVGIEASEKINQENLTKEVSFSTKAIKDRLLLLKDYYKSDIGFEYEEILEGTKVILKIPYNT
ncbi:sensor histidine kinase [Polaribacter sp. Q13]|uniref:sensor histidine kinase n=1 Tax=Polaribacter sp. Q13 TaxID=2806551 RepID=UPI00193AF79F|nr:histidine kinase [Polaribacter sp. Q13]QVY67207.1 histidine kinase [Polaribacter sp. Q13]